MFETSLPTLRKTFDVIIIFDVKTFAAPFSNIGYEIKRSVAEVNTRQQF